MYWTLLTGIIVLTLGGCTQKYWVKDGATEADFKRDSWECKNRTVTSYGGYTQMGPGHAIMAGFDIGECMEAHGYRLESPRTTSIEEAEREYVPPSQQQRPETSSVKPDPFVNWAKGSQQK